jgi:hypothetical protein
MIDRAQRLWARHGWRGIRPGVFLVVTLFLAFFLFWLDLPGLGPAEKTTLFVGLVASAVVGLQAYLIKRQVLFGTTVELYREWTSEEMLRKRKAAWSGGEPNPDAIEDVLEFLEKVATFEKERFISRGLIWDTFGWYMSRYYFYCQDVIRDRRSCWAPDHPDNTLYQDVQELYPKLLRIELAERDCKRGKDRKLTEKDVEKELGATKAKFIKSERGQADD